MSFMTLQGVVGLLGTFCRHEIGAVHSYNFLGKREAADGKSDSRNISKGRSSRYNLGDIFGAPYTLRQMNAVDTSAKAYGKNRDTLSRPGRRREYRSWSAIQIVRLSREPGNDDDALPEP